MAKIDFIALDGLHALVALNIKFARTGTTWALIASGAVNRLLRLADHDKLLPAVGSATEALTASPIQPGDLPPLSRHVTLGLPVDQPAIRVRGDDIDGIALHIGARVSALAGPNDVLVSSTLRDLVIGSGLEFDDRRVHEPKGVTGEWCLFALASS